MSKVEMIERSLSCFRLGLVSMIPLIGIPIAILVLSKARRIKRGKGAQWNPAERYLFWGAMCARVGLWPYVILAVAMFLAQFVH